MKLLNHNAASSAVRALQPWILYFLLLILSTYVAIDLLANHTDFPLLICSSNRLFPEKHIEREGICSSRDDYYEARDNSTENYNGSEPWKQMKWVGEAASCRVKGHLIEKLDVENNFRRGFALKFSDDVEDKTHILPWLLASKVDLNRRQRRVYLDLGANSFSTSITWFIHMYPCDFTEIHAFEVNQNLLKKPAAGFEESSNYAAPNEWSVRVKQTPGMPRWMLDRIKIYYKFVSDEDNEAHRSINITRFIKEELKLKASDTVVVKMDIEGSEWPILRRWMGDPEMVRIVDELFVEVHYDHPSMRGYHWARFAPIKREEAKRLLADLRWHGFFVHAWP